MDEQSVVKSIGVVGSGLTGLSCLQYFSAQSVAIHLYDSREQPPNLSVIREKFPAVQLHLGNISLAECQRVSQFVISPGADLSQPALQAIRHSGLPVYSDLDVFAAATSKPYVTITGSNGKTTVTQLVTAMMAACQHTAVAIGNIGQPVLQQLLEQPPSDYAVIECSSFQLQYSQLLQAKVAAFLNFSADHIDRHGSLEAYYAAKKRVYQGAEAAVYWRQQDSTAPTALLKHNGRSFALTPPETDKDWGIVVSHGQTYLARGQETVWAVKNMRQQQPHFLLNALAALAICDCLALDYQRAAKVLQTFIAMAHRFQVLPLVQGVTYINDSKATNVGATLAALQSVRPMCQGKKVYLLAGGQAKGADLSELLPAIQEQVRALITFGSDGPLLEEICRHSVRTYPVPSLAEAVRTASALATSGDIVLLSPACASLDSYANYQQRGEEFIRLVDELREQVS